MQKTFCYQILVLLTILCFVIISFLNLNFVQPLKLSNPSNKIFSSFLMSIRAEYAPVLERYGFTDDEICEMSDAEFQKSVQYVLSQQKYYSQPAATQYRYVSPKIYAQQQATRKAPLVANDSGFEPAYQPNSINNYPSYEQQYYQGYEPDYDEEEAIRQAMMNSINDYEEYQAKMTRENEEQYYQQNQVEQQDNYHNEYPEQSEDLPIQEEPEQPQQVQEEEQIPQSSYSYSYVQPKNVGYQTENQRILSDQDREYNEACEKAFSEEMNNRQDEYYEANNYLIQEEMKREREAAVLGKYYGLPEEPKQGVTIAVMMNGKRLIRKFNPDEYGIDVYAWVAGQTIDEEPDSRLYFDNFELGIGGGHIIDMNQTLQEQGVTGRVLININML